MKLKSQQRWLLAALTATLLAAYFAPPEEDVALPAVREGKAQEPRPRVSRRQPASPPEPVLHLRERKPSELGESLFAAEAARRPAPAPTAPVQAVTAVAPPPMAPALPFRIFGYYEDDGGFAVFLHDGSGVLSAKAGDMLSNGRYRIDSITRGRVNLTYLPLQQPQTLAWGDLP